jgi:DnaJ family protein A protein 2
MPSYRHHDFGNLYIQFEVKFPESIPGPPGQDGYPTSMTEQQVKALESVLPKRKPQSIPPQDAMTEDYALEKVDPMQEGQRAQRAAMDDEDDDMHAGGERVQCASQ